MKFFCLVLLFIPMGIFSSHEMKEQSRASEIAPKEIVAIESASPKKLRPAGTIPRFEPKCELRLIAFSKMRAGKNWIKIRIRNVGKIPVKLVLPHWLWPTPIVRWSIFPDHADESHPGLIFPRAGCGLTEAPEMKDICTIKPNESKTFSAHTGFPKYEIKPGKYRMAFHYTNDPTLNWEMVNCGPIAKDVVEEIRSSTSISLVSNEIFVEIVE